MYTAFYSLQKKPFSMTPDPSFLYMTSQHREALTGLTYAILDRKGFLVLSGKAGVGKTTVLAWVLERLPYNKVRSSVILNPTLKPEEFLELALLDFGITDVPASKAQRLWILQRFLVEGRKEGKVNVLIVDEAHKLSWEVLEEIRLLGNMESGEEKLIQILLLGQSELDDVLNSPGLWQLKQRISVRLTLDALSTDDVERYIQHRWTVAGGKAHPFTLDAIAQLKQYSRGIPRLINSLSDNSLIQAFADESLTVTVAHVNAAADDLQLIEKVEKPVEPAPLMVLPVVAHAPTAAPVVDRPAVAEETVEVPAGPPLRVIPVNGHAKNGTVLPMLESYPQPKRWFLLRWADKLGLTYNAPAERSDHAVTGKKK